MSKQRTVAERIEGAGLNVDHVVQLALHGSWLTSPERNVLLANAAHARATCRRLDFLQLHYVDRKGIDQIADDMGITTPGLAAVEASLVDDLRLDRSELPSPPRAMRVHRASRSRTRTKRPTVTIDLAEAVSLASTGQWAESTLRAQLETSGHSRAITGTMRRLDFIELHYGREMPVREIAAKWGMTPQHLYVLDHKLSNDLGVDCSHLPALLERRLTRSGLVLVDGVVAALEQDATLTPVQVAKRVGVPARSLRERLGVDLYTFAFPALSSGARGRSVTISDEEMLDAIRRAHAQAGKGDTLSANAYNAVRYGHEDTYPFSLTIMKRFGSWSAAVGRAGLRSGGTPRKADTGAVDDDSAAQIIAEFLLEGCGASIGDYQEWARSRTDAPLQIQSSGRRSWSERLRGAQHLFLPGASHHNSYTRRLRALAHARQNELSH